MKALIVYRSSLISLGMAWLLTIRGVTALTMVLPMLNKRPTHSDEFKAK